MNDEASPRANAKVYDEASVFEPDSVLAEALRLCLAPPVLGSACWAQGRLSPVMGSPYGATVRSARVDGEVKT